MANPVSYRRISTVVGQCRCNKEKYAFQFNDLGYSVPQCHCGTLQQSGQLDILMYIHYSVYMWKVITSKRVEKKLQKLPARTLRKYQVWLEIVEIGGPQNLRQIPGFSDEALHGQLSGCRSSRLDISTRLIYTVHRNTVTVNIEEITAQHDYRKK